MHAAYRPELDELAERWWTQENEQKFDIGCPDHHDRPALINIVEAAVLLCAGEHEAVVELLLVALTLELESEARRPRP